jgi:hypothetical protein
MKAAGPLRPQDLGLRGDGRLANLLGVIFYQDAPEKILRWPNTKTLVRLCFRRRIEPWILAERRVLFVHVPRNAGTSASVSVYGRTTHHRTALFYKTAAPDLYAQADVFAILRDPIERFKSAYWFVRNGGGADVALDVRFAALCRGVETPDDLLNLVARHLGDVYGLDHVLRPQSWYVRDAANRSIVPNLFVLHEDNQALARFLAERGMRPLPHLNATAKSRLDLGESHVNRLRDLYAADFALLEAARRERAAEARKTDASAGLWGSAAGAR